MTRKVEELHNLRRIWYNGGYWGPNIMDYEDGEWKAYEKEGVMWYPGGYCEKSLFHALNPVAIKLDVDLTEFNIKYITVRHLIESIAEHVGSFKEKGKLKHHEDITVDIYKKENGDLILLKSSMEIGEVHSYPED